MKLPKTYGEQLRAARKAAAMTQAALAAKIEMSTASISNYERSFATVPAWRVGKVIEKLLGVAYPPDYLAYWQQRMLIERLADLVQATGDDAVLSQARCLQRDFEWMFSEEE